MQLLSLCGLSLPRRWRAQQRAALRLRFLQNAYSTYFHYHHGTKIHFQNGLMFYQVNTLSFTNCDLQYIYQVVIASYQYISFVYLLNRVFYFN